MGPDLPGEGERMPELQLHDLDECTRRFMLDELEQDVSQSRLYMSPRLSELGRTDYERLLRAALESGSEGTLADELRSHGRMQLDTRWARAKGSPIVSELPATAPDMLAEGEFHRFYLRGLCRRAIEEGIRTLEIYRAKPAPESRSKSEAMVGVRIDASSLLEDLRRFRGEDPPRGLPQCPDSGLSVRRPVA